MPSKCVDGKGWKAKEAGVCRCDSIAVRHRDGNGGSGDLVVGVGCFNQYVVAGTVGIYDEVDMDMVLMVGYGV